MAVEDVYCTLVMSDAYLPGAAVLAQSLRDAGTQRKLACLTTQDSLRPETVTELQSLYNFVIPIERIATPSPAHLYLMSRPDLLYAFTKINLWRLTQFRKIVFLDADVVALRAPDELFDLPDSFAAAPDVGWPDAFNTGVMVVAPHMGDFWALKTLAAAGDSFDGADQGLLNQYFEHKPWKRLSFTYNCTPSANYQYEPAYRYYKRDISLVHFIGASKPWHVGRPSHGAPSGYQELLSRWWAVYDRHFRVSTAEYTNTGRREPAHQAVHEEVAEPHGPETYSASGYPIEAASTEPAPTEPAVEPPPPFSAPPAEWDATRGGPPAGSGPEGGNLPMQSYEFTSDPSLFRPPSSYPQPPKDMWYDVPKEERPKPSAQLPPKPIFPWEERGDAQKPSRRFAEDEEPPAAEPTPPAPDADEESFIGAADELEVSADEKKAPAAAPAEPHAAFGATNKNAWDDVSGIEQYVRALAAHQKNRGSEPTAPTAPPLDSASKAAAVAVALEQQHVLSPGNEPDPAELIEKVRQRRESLILTDFPSASERPSLPVTPAPRRRSSFWGEDKDEEGGDLPAAEGVPDQADWNPEEQLEQLRRNSLLGAEHLKHPGHTSIPNRDMPSTSAPIPEEALGHPHVPVGGGEAAAPGAGSSSDAPEAPATETTPPAQAVPQPLPETTTATATTTTA